MRKSNEYAIGQRYKKTTDYRNLAIPTFEEKYLVEDSKEYPVSFNGKVRFKIELPLGLSNEEVEKIVLEDERTISQVNGNPPKKIIVVQGKIINIVG